MNNLLAKPLIGICRNAKQSTFLGTRYKPYLRLGTKLPATIFVFSPQDINWKKETVKGYILKKSDHKETFVKQVLPLPSVVLNKITNRNEEASKHFKTMRQNFSQRGIKMFNPRFFNKEEISKLLVKHKILAKHTPKTKYLLNVDNLAESLNKFKALYVKPKRGSLGLGVAKVTRLKNQKYQVKYRTAQRQNKSFQVTSVKQLYNRLISITGKNCIIQEAINLTTYQSRIFDMRILMQKNGYGEWIRTFACGRQAAPGSVVSNVGSGGKVINFTTLLQTIVPEETPRNLLDHQIDLLSKQIANYLEQHFQHLGEISIDLGLDKAGKLWIIEINSKHTSEAHLPKQTKTNCILRPLQYALLLAG